MFDLEEDTKLTLFDYHQIKMLHATGHLYIYIYIYRIL